MPRQITISLAVLAAFLVGAETYMLKQRSYLLVEEVGSFFGVDFVPPTLMAEPDSYLLASVQFGVIAGAVVLLIGLIGSFLVGFLWRPRQTAKETIDFYTHVLSVFFVCAVWTWVSWRTLPIETIAGMVDWEMEDMRQGSRRAWTEGYERWRAKVTDAEVAACLSPPYDVDRASILTEWNWEKFVESAWVLGSTQEALYVQLLVEGSRAFRGSSRANAANLLAILHVFDPSSRLDMPVSFYGDWGKEGEMDTVQVLRKVVEGKEEYQFLPAAQSLDKITAYCRLVEDQPLSYDGCLEALRLDKAIMESRAPTATGLEESRKAGDRTAEIESAIKKAEQELDKSEEGVSIATARSLLSAQSVGVRMLGLLVMREVVRSQEPSAEAVFDVVLPLFSDDKQCVRRGAQLVALQAIRQSPGAPRKE